MTDLITQIKQIIEDEAEKYSKNNWQNWIGVELKKEPITISYKAGAEFLLPIIEKLIEKLNKQESQALGVVYESSFKTEKKHFEWFNKELNQELLNTLKGGEK